MEKKNWKQLYIGGYKFRKQTKQNMYCSKTGKSNAHFVIHFCIVAQPCISLSKIIKNMQAFMRIWR